MQCMTIARSVYFNENCIFLVNELIFCVKLLGTIKDVIFNGRKAGIKITFVGVFGSKSVEL